MEASSSPGATGGIVTASPVNNNEPRGKQRLFDEGDVIEHKYTQAQASYDSWSKNTKHSWSQGDI